LSSFDSPNEETRQAASYALGNVAVGSLEKYLPQVLEEIKKSPKTKYLLMHSLKEIIVRQSGSPSGVEALKGYEKDLLPLLYDNCESEEEGTRNVVAECLGKLAIVSPKELVPTLVERVKSESANTRSTVVTALKFGIVERPQEVDRLLLPEMAKFLELLKDKDLNVRRNTLLTLNYAAHNKPILIRNILPDYLPLIFGESKVKPELIREVDLGPFKHKVDDGLEIRKAAFECMYTLLDTCLDRVNVPAFIANLVDGLKDQYDIKTLSHLMLIRLAALSGPALLEGLDQLVEPLRATVATKAKEGAVNQEVERNDELIRSSLRAIASITRIPNVESNVKFEEFLKQTVKTGELGEKFAAIKAEGERAESAVDSMDIS
jgi:cullin-associated NEDD8-dissociated protein 1